MATVIINPDLFAAILLRDDLVVKHWGEVRPLRARINESEKRMCDGCIHGDHCGLCRCVCRELWV